MDYVSELKGMDHDLNWAVLRVLSARPGKGRAISQNALTAAVSELGFVTPSRRVRDAIKFLRRDGFMICSKAGRGGGYYMAQSWDDYDSFRKDELAARITDLTETMRAMDKAAKMQFGEAHQVSLL